MKSLELDLRRMGNEKMLIKNYGETNFVTGMRTYAAFAVVLIHSGGAGLRSLGAIGNNIANFGLTGVYVFFVISGFSVAASYRENIGYLGYLNHRFWRIAPLYYFWLVYAICHVDFSIYNILMHFFFVSFVDFRIANSMLSVEWSIPIEVFWYTLLPLLLMFGKNLGHLLVLILFSFLLYVGMDQLVGFQMDPELSSAWRFSPLSYVVSYALGVTAFRLRSIWPVLQEHASFIFFLSLLLVTLFLIKPTRIERLFYSEYVFVSLVSFGLIVSGSAKSWVYRLVFANKPVLFLGTISYGIYLGHLFILGVFNRSGVPVLVENTFPRFLFGGLGSVAIATLTFYLLEKPALRLGRRMGNLFSAKTSVSTQ